MVWLRLCKRNRLSFFRVTVVVISFGVMFLLLKNLGSSDTVESVDFDINIMTTEDTGQKLQDTNEAIRRNNILPRKYSTLTTNQAKPVQINNLKPIQIQPLDTYSNLAELRATIRRLNYEQNIINMDKFPKRSEDSIVVVVQVHKRSTYLKKLIESFREAEGISDALLIISHDFYATEVNEVVQSIDFCQVLQIFFPYSPQLHPDKFPGADPRDCPRDTPKSQARTMGCINAEHPDMYGHYREVKFTMTKHHWWWKANHVFHKLRSTKNHNGLVLLLEEDHYVSPDFYKVLKKAYHIRKTHTKCREYGCDIITLGDYKTVSSYGEVGSEVLRIQPWRSTENNMGMAFDRETWKSIRDCSEVFCTYDDYNWDFTLMRMSLRCLKKQLTVLLFVAPRVFHLGTCGLHHAGKNCGIETVLARAQEVIERSKKVLNPQRLEIEIAQPFVPGHFGQPNGGWGDTRDHELCINFTKSTN